MNILHIINNLGSGGAEKLLTDIMPLMKEEGHSVTLAISNGAQNIQAYDHIFEKNQIEVIDFKSSFYNPLLIFKYGSLLRKRRFDIVHAHLFPSQYWLAFASYFIPKKTRLIKTEHSVLNKRRSYPILRPLEKFMYRRYDQIVAITEMVKVELVKWVHIKHVEIIHNGVNLKQVIAAREKTKTIQPNILNTGSFNILMTGSFDGFQKDQASLIKAISLLDEGTHAYFAGEGSFMDETKKLVHTLGLEEKIHFLGMRTDIYELMSSVDLNVLSTNHEGLSGVTLESMASGKPFIGSRVGGVMDIVPDDSFYSPLKTLMPWR